MPDIFVSYARQDREQVRLLATRLESFGWTVWWDRQILAGTDYDVVIERALDAARAVVVVWSKHSVASRWVKTEATEGLKREVLVPIVLDNSTPPLAFRNLQSVAFAGTPIEANSPPFDELIEALTSLLGSRPHQPPAETAPEQKPDIRPPAPYPLPISRPPVASPPATPPEIRGPSRTSGGSKGLVLAAAAVIVLGLVGVWMFRGRSSDAGPQTPAAAVPPAGSPQPAPANATPTPAPEPPKPAPASAEPSPPPAAIAPAEAEALVRDFLGAINAGDEERMLAFYASQVDYFTQGVVGVDSIRKDRQAYRKRWPEITLTLVGDMAVRDADTPRKSIVTAHCTYEVGSPARAARATGTLEVTFQLARVDGSLKIVDQKEVSRSDRR